MVNVYGGREWSAATRDFSNFFGHLNASKIFYDQYCLWLGPTAAVTGAKRPRSAQILRGRVETCFYYQDSYGLLVSCVIEGVTEGHRRLMAITTGAKRRVFVTNRSRDWSEATSVRDQPQP